MPRSPSLSLRHAAAAACFFFALSAAFQLPGPGSDGLRSDASGLRERGLWAATSSRPAAAGDYATYLAPWASFIQQEIQAGRLPLWNPYVGTGVPVAETALPALFHPFTLLLFGLPFEHALTLMAVIRLALAGLGAFLLARVMGCSAPGGIAAGLLFMFSPFHLWFCFHPLANASMLLPFLLVVSELRVRGASARRAGAAWALLGTLMLLGGHGETTAHCVGVAWLYHLLRTANLATKRERWKHLRAEAVFLSICTFLAVLGGAVVVFGHLAVLSESLAIPVRSALGYRHLPLGRLPPLLLPGLRDPYLYLGIAALLFAARGAGAKGPFPAAPWVLIGSLALLAAYAVWPLPLVIG